MSLAFGGLLPTYPRGIWSILPSELPTYLPPNPRRQRGTQEKEKGPEKGQKTFKGKEKKSKEEEKKEKEEKAQHRAFPRGPPPQYYPGSNLLNFAVRMGSGEPG